MIQGGKRLDLLVTGCNDLLLMSEASMGRAWWTYSTATYVLLLSGTATGDACRCVLL